MKLRTRSFDYTFFSLFIFVLALFSGLIAQNLPYTSAQTENNQAAPSDSQTPRFVTIFDQGTKTTVRTTAPTVGALLERAHLAISPADIIEPDLHAEIDADNFFVNIYRARPVLVIDGLRQQVIQTASYDGKNIAELAGFTLYDGDTVELSTEPRFSTSGVVSTYQVRRHGGETITSELILPAPVEEKEDKTLKVGERKTLQVGEDGRKIVKYQVRFLGGREESRTVVSEQILTQPKPKIVAVGVKTSPSVAILPSDSDCATYIRAAGVAPADLSAALELITRESRCRTNATNAYSGAYGIPQALPGHKMASEGADWETNPVTQIKWMDKYVKKRYGGWQKALDFWHCIGTCQGVNKRSFWY